jgi:acyl carrier protein
MTPTETRLIDVLTKGLKLQRQTPITPATGIFGKGGPGGDALGLDSVDVLEIAVLVDKHFGVMLEEANEEVRDALANIGNLAAFIDRHGGQTA